MTMKWLRPTLRAALLALPALPLYPVPVASGAAAFQTETPVRSNDLFESVGINVHLHNGDTPYGNFAVISSAIHDLGVQHTRDGLIVTTWQGYYDRHKTLAGYGIHCDFITGPDRSEAQMREFLEKVPGIAEALEGPNEYDHAGVADRPSRVSAFMPVLQRLAQHPPNGPALRLIGPSLIDADSSAKVPQLSNYFGYANIHNYFAGRNPGTAGWGDNGYGSIPWNLAQSKKGWGPKPIVSTETGYLSDATQQEGIGETAQATYLPRLVFEQRLHGIERTYLYELSDANDNTPGGERSFGLIRKDGTRKPSFTATQRLLQTLRDPGPDSRVRPLAFRLEGAPPEMHHMLLQRRNGHYLLAFWLEVPSYDPVAHHPVSVTPVPFTLALASPARSARLLSMDPAATPEGKAMPGGGARMSLVAGDAVSILDFVAAP